MLVTKMSLENFKGISKLDVEFAKTTTISGTNGTGKTTVLNAFLWVLTGKDVEGRSDYEIKPRGESKINSTVTISITIDGAERTLKRMYKEKWVKANGQLEAAFTGHTTNFEIDGLPAKKAEYENFVKETFGEVALLSSPKGFMQLDWKRLRAILVEMAGQGKPDHSEVKSIIGERDPDEVVTLLKTQRNSMSKNREGVLFKIEERENDLAETDDVAAYEGKAEEMSASITMKSGKIEGIRQNILEAKTIGSIEALQTELQKKQGEKTEAINATNERNRKLSAESNTEKDALLYAVNKLKSSLSLKSNELADHNTRLETFPKLRENLISDYNVINSRKFNREAANCNSCAQSLPSDRIDDLEEAFNVEKADKLSANVEKGKDLNNRKEDCEKLITSITSDIEDLTPQLEKKQEELNAALRESEPTTLEAPETSNLDTEIEAIKAKIQTAQTDHEAAAAEAITGFNKEIDVIEDDKLAVLNILAKMSKRADARIRIESLRQESVQIEKDYNKIGEDLFDLEEFIKGLLENTSEAINSMFKTIDFRLFADQVNGGYKSVCDPMINGVPYNSANHAAKITAGVEVAQVLQNYKKVQLPIFIDNRESIVTIPEVEAQIVNLVVMKSKKTLEIKGE